MIVAYVLSRAILLFEHSDLVVLAALGVIFNSGVPGPTKVGQRFNKST